MSFLDGGRAVLFTSSVMMCSLVAEDGNAICRSIDAYLLRVGAQSLLYGGVRTTTLVTPSHDGKGGLHGDCGRVHRV